MDLKIERQFNLMQLPLKAGKDGNSKPLFVPVTVLIVKSPLRLKERLIEMIEGS